MKKQSKRASFSYVATGTETICFLTLSGRNRKQVTRVTYAGVTLKPEKTNPYLYIFSIK